VQVANIQDLLRQQELQTQVVEVVEHHHLMQLHPLLQQVVQALLLLVIQQAEG
jgi:hypothetical protein